MRSSSSVGACVRAILGSRFSVLHSSFLLTALGLTVAVAAIRAQAPLPVIEVEAALFHEHCRNLLEAAERVRLLSADERRQMDEQLKVRTPQSVEQLQKLLDRHCLAGVSINPESRVKAARGAASADLVLDRPGVFLVKVHNEAGVTHALTIGGPQLRDGKQQEAERWLEAVVLTDKPLTGNLTGNRVEYVLVRLTAREAGKREATLKFDVGQGTQDLGFRAEVPVLFTIRRE